MTLTFILKILIDDVVPRIDEGSQQQLRALFPRPRLAARLAVSLPGTLEEQMVQQADFMSRMKDSNSSCSGYHCILDAESTISTSGSLLEGTYRVGCSKDASHNGI